MLTWLTRRQMAGRWHHYIVLVAVGLQGGYLSWVLAAGSCWHCVLCVLSLERSDSLSSHYAEGGSKDLSLAKLFIFQFNFYKDNAKYLSSGYLVHRTALLHIMRRPLIPTSSGALYNCTWRICPAFCSWKT